MKQIKYIFPVLLAFILLSSCGGVKPVSVSKIEKVKLHSFTKSSAELEVTMVLKNPNRYKFRVVDNHLDLYLNNSEMGRVTIKDRIVIPKKSEQAYTFIIETKFSRLAMGSIPSLINMFKTKQMELKLVGDVKVRSMFVSKRFPLEISERVDFTRKGE